MPEPLNDESLDRAARWLGSIDPALGDVLERWGAPPLWARDAGFATLVHLILEQQVSLASAQAAMDRLVEAIGPPVPEVLLDLDDETMLRIGFSRQKRGYARALASRILDGGLDLAALEALDDEDVRARLTESKGIGDWTADIYLLMALGRPDVWPVGDRALVVALRELKRLPADPDASRMLAAGEAWRPWRSVAARMLWHLYLSEIRPPSRAGTPADRQR